MTDLDKLRADAETARQYAQHHGVKIWTEHIFAVLALADAALARVAKVEALHRRYGIFELEDSCPDTSDEHREEHHHECADEVGEFYCDQMPVGAVCDECRTEDGERVDWPCQTVRALTEGENE